LHTLSEFDGNRSAGEGDILIFVGVKPIFVQVRIGQRACRAIQLEPLSIIIVPLPTSP